MHFEVPVEDESEHIPVDVILRKIPGENGALHSWRVHPYKGTGRIPNGLRGETDSAKRILQNRLSKLLRGYGKSLDASSAGAVDLDDRDYMAFNRELLAVPNTCRLRPKTLFGIAIEGIEAWLLGDRTAMKTTYPSAKDAVLDRYRQDAICGTWEVLADAVHAGGAETLMKEGWPAPGVGKCAWAREIAPHIIPDRNLSPSFKGFPD